MPDEADVEQALAAWVAGVLYPAGAGAVSAVETVCRVYRGAPVSKALEADLVGDVAHVTVRHVVGHYKDTTRYPAEWAGVVPACPLQADGDGEVVRFSGEAGPGMVAGVAVDGRAYATRVTEVSSPGLVAAVLAGMVRADRPVGLSGGTLTFPGGRGVLARAAMDGAGGTEVRRQESSFGVTLWCPSPGVRDQLGAFVDMNLAGLVFLDVGGWGCRLQGAGGRSSDEGEVVRCWRRELSYRIEYPTVLAESLPSMLFGVGRVNGAGFLA